MTEHEKTAQIAGVLADRVDGEPPAVLGLTTTELKIVALTTGLVVLPSMILIGWILGLGNMVLAVTGFVFIGGIVVGSKIFRKLKRGHPDGHYQVKFAITMQRLFGGKKFILRSGYWSTGRTVRAASRRR